MTFWSSTGARRGLLLTALFVIVAACAKVDRGYDADAASGGAEAGSAGSSAGSSSAGKAGSSGSEAGEGGEAGSAGAPPQVTLTVVLDGDGEGVVTSDLEGIDCGNTCAADYDVGTEVVLTAAPVTGSSFAGWAGAGCTGTGTCTTTLEEATEVTATFKSADHPLKVAKAGTGLGSVTSLPAGISCGADCEETIADGTKVTLTAVAAAGSSFTGWSGGGCAGTAPCAVTVAAASTVTATFACTPGTATVNYSGVITSFAVPTCVTSLTIDAYGAQGGNGGAFLGGFGARMKGTFAVTGGATLKVLVGGRGVDALNNEQQGAGSGGGGTFVTTALNAPLVVAGGGGGAYNYSVPAAGQGGVITTAGLPGGGGVALGGTNGLGGYTSIWTGWHGGTGGGGLLGNGMGNSAGQGYGTPYSPGLAFVNGGTGGQPGSCVGVPGCQPGRPGGFGGGGAAAFTGGGGGGYSGGGAGEYDLSGSIGTGGGGGSYNSGTLQTNTAATRIGNGVVIFTY